MGATIRWQIVKPKECNAQAMRLELLSALHKVEREVKKDFQKTTETWEHDVKFESSISTRGGVAQVEAGTRDRIYGYVNNGTRPHDIWAGIYTGKSRRKALRFPGTFRAKTRPGYLTSYRGYKGGAIQYRAHVHHPGTEARGFDKAIEKRWRTKFASTMRAAMKSAALKSGHTVR